MFVTALDAWKSASGAAFAATEAQIDAWTGLQAQAHAQWRAQLAFWAALNPMLAPWVALAEALDPEQSAATAVASSCGPLRAAPRRKSAA